MRLVAEHATDGFWDWDLRTGALFVSRSFGALLGYDADEAFLDQAAVGRLVHPDDLARARAAYEAHLNHAVPYQECLRYQPKDGSWTWVMSRASVLRSPSGEPERMVGTHTDISSLKQAELDLRELTTTLEQRVEQRTAELAASEALFRTVFDAAPGGAFVVDAAGTVVLANSHFVTVLGRPVEDLIGSPLAAWIPGMPTGAGPHPASILDGVRPDGQRVPLEVGVSEVVLRGERHQVGFVADLSQRRRAEADLARSEARFRISFENAGIAKALQDPDGRVRAVNHAFCALLGYSEAELLGRTLAELTHPEDRPLSAALNARLLTGETPAIRIEKRFIRKDGTIVWAGLTKVLLRSANGLAETMAEVQELSSMKEAAHQQRALERKLLEAAKLESLGVLAGGVAHDFNNILTGMLASADSLASALAGDAGLAAHAQDVVTACRRAAAICNQLLAYSGRGQFALVDTDLSWLVADTERLIRLSLGKSVRLVLDLARGLIPVHVDRAQIQQVIMNLVINGSEAITVGPGTITVRTSCIAAHRAVPRGSLWVALDVQDDGTGISPENLARIFDPFFTTKFKGRGLGLAAVQGIVNGHGGTLDVSSEVGRGTRFRMLLPAVGPVEEPAGAGHGGPDLRTPLAGTILLVDDEAPVRRAVRRILVQLGLVVVDAGDGVEAVALFAAEPTRFDLVLLDLTMPGMDGSEALTHLARIRPDVRVVLTSGYSESEATADFVGRGLAAFLKKPFDQGELITVVRAALA